jgi:hypothetical protein
VPSPKEVQRRNAVGIQLTALIRGSGMSHAQTCKGICSRQFLSAIKGGFAHLPDHLRLKLAERLGVDPSKLLPPEELR